MTLIADHFDMPDQEQPGDAREAIMRAMRELPGGPVYPPEIAVYIEAGISDIMMGTMREAVSEACLTGLSVSRIQLDGFYADANTDVDAIKPVRTRQFPEPHRYDHRVAMSKLEGIA
jgi:hypothetical protein